MVSPKILHPLKEPWLAPLILIVVLLMVATGIVSKVHDRQRQAAGYGDSFLAFAHRSDHSVSASSVIVPLVQVDAAGQRHGPPSIVPSLKEPFPRVFRIEEPLKRNLGRHPLLRSGSAEPTPRFGPFRCGRRSLPILIVWPRVCPAEMAANGLFFCSEEGLYAHVSNRVHSLIPVGSDLFFDLQRNKIARASLVPAMLVVNLCLLFVLVLGLTFFQRDRRRRKRIERGLRRQLDLFQTIMNVSAAPIWVKTMEGVYRFINPAGAAVWERRVEEIIGKVDADFLPPAMVQRYFEHEEGLRENGDEATVEEWVDLGDGTPRCFLTTRSLFYDQHGQPAGMLCFSQEVTRQKQATDEVQRSEALFRAIFDSAAVGIALVDQHNQFLKINRCFSDFLGYAPDELIGTRLIDITCADDPETLQDRGTQANRVQALLKAEKRYIRKDGRLVWGQVNASVVRLPGEAHPLRLAMVQDIDGRKKAEMALQQSESRYRLLFSAGYDGILICDVNSGRLIETNRACEAMFKASEAELKLRTWKDLCVDPDSVVKAFQGDDRPVCVTLKRLDGSEFMAEITMGAFDWYGMKWATAILRDVTERQKMEELKDEMLSSVSHEMRTPLTAMLGFSEFMLENDVSADQRREYLGIVHRETSRLKELIDNLLNLQRLRAGFGLLERGPLSLPVLLRDLQLTYAPQAPSHTFEIVCARDLPVLWVDETQLHRALGNLVSNAIKYAPDGGKIELGGCLEPQGTVCIWVRDEGLGIPEASVELIFDRFYRVGMDGKQRIGGTGLGLPLVKEIIRRHDGEVWVETEQGQGSTFYVRLPLGYGDETDVPHS